MPIWRLSSIDLADPSWQASSHHGPAMVRARDEDEARDIAQAAFGVKTGFPPGVGIIAPPWRRPDLVGAEICHDSPHDSDGASEILEPSFARDLEGESRKNR